MKANSLIPLIIICMSVITFETDGAKQFENVGAEVCGRCHSRDYRMTQYDIWLASPHARAARTLSTEKGREIAGRKGIDKPDSDERCLECHTTGGGKTAKTRAEGVGCEACHGPGSLYESLDNHTDFRYRRNGYMKAKKNGMYPILDYEPDLKKREKLCLSCHRDTRPCFPPTNEEILRQKITIQVVDTLRKGDLDFSHPIRTY